MFNCFISAVLKQITQLEGQPPRDKTYTIDGLTSFKTEQISWKNLAGSAKIIFPKNIFVVLASGDKVRLGQPANLQNNIPIVASFGNQSPIVMRGDEITVTMGYGYQAQSGKWSIKYQPPFIGFVSKVHNKTPIELELEDNMWFAKQTQCQNMMYPASEYAMEDILYLLVQQINSQWGSNLTLADTPTGTYIPNQQQNQRTNIGDFRIENETVAQVLERLQKDYRMEAYFRGNALHCALFTYLPHASPYTVTLDGVEYNYDSKFIFEQNILPDHKLEYCRADDINISVDAFSINKNVLDTGKKTKSGKDKTKKARLETFVTILNGKPTVLNPNDPKTKTKSEDCEVVQAYFWNVTDINVLNKMAFAKLNRIYFNGFRGTFVTFGLPYVQHGDIIYIQSITLPERNGLYFVKGVSYEFSVDGGMRQELELDMKIDGIFQTSDLQQGV